MQDPYFTNALEERWTSLRLNELSDINIMGIVDELVGELEDSDAITEFWQMVNIGHLHLAK